MTWLRPWAAARKAGQPSYQTPEPTKTEKKATDKKAVKRQKARQAADTGDVELAQWRPSTTPTTPATPTTPVRPAASKSPSPMPATPQASIDYAPVFFS